MDRKLVPLRGRVAVRPISDVRNSVLHIPDTYDQAKIDRSQGILAQSSHRGVVLCAGAPALQYGHEVPHGFLAGDEVVYVFGANGTEASRRGFFGEERCVWLAQEEVIAVVDR